MSADPRLRVFPSTGSGHRLCHASQDKPVVREFYQRLLAEAWIDPWLERGIINFMARDLKQ